MKQSGEQRRRRRRPKVYSRQCVLERKIENGTINQISWIPEQFAKVGRFLKLLEKDVWENGWQVVSVGGRQSREERIERGRDHVNQRKGSDI